MTTTAKACACKIKYACPVHDDGGFRSRWSDPHEIEMCPLHAAAEEMREALNELSLAEKYYRDFPRANELQRLDRAQAAAHAALAKAEGKA